MDASKLVPLVTPAAALARVAWGKFNFDPAADLRANLSLLAELPADEAIDREPLVQLINDQVEAVAARGRGRTTRKIDGRNLFAMLFVLALGAFVSWALWDWGDSIGGPVGVMFEAVAVVIGTILLLLALVGGGANMYKTQDSTDPVGDVPVE